MCLSSGRASVSTRIREHCCSCVQFIVFHAMQSMRQGSHRTTDVLEDCMEAILGAMYEDQGADFAREWLVARLRCIITLSDASLLTRNWNVALRTRCPQMGMAQPEYRRHSGHEYPDPASPWPIVTSVYSIALNNKVR